MSRTSIDLSRLSLDDDILDARPRGASSLHHSELRGGTPPEVAAVFADTESDVDPEFDTPGFDAPEFDTDESEVLPDLPRPQQPAAAPGEAAATSGRTTADGMDLDLILRDRPDVFQGFFTEYYGANNDRNSGAWEQRVGGATPQDYANYWYEKHGKWEGYTQPGKTAHEVIDIEQLLRDRPDVFQGFFTAYYGADNDRHSSAWVNRVGGETVQDYARYWYDTYGWREGYTQRPPSSETPGSPSEPETPSEPENPPDDGSRPPIEDPSLDPWNHPALYPDAQRPADAPGPEVTSVGQALLSIDPLG